MNILLVEDDEFKEERIVNFICEKITSANVDISRSVYSAIQFTKSQIYDFVILDMALPGHDISVGSGPASSLPAGGLHVALELDFAGRKDKIVVVTQYPDIEVDGELIETLSAVSYTHLTLPTTPYV